MSLFPSLPVWWQCRHQDPLVSAESIGGRKILLNTLSASRTTTIWVSGFLQTVVKPERFSPDTTRVSKWYQEATLKGDVSHFSSFSRTSNAFAETGWTSVQEPIEDEVRLVMKRGEIPLPLLKRLANPRIRDGKALHDFFKLRQDLMMLTHKHGMITLDLFPKSARKKGKDVELLKVPTFQCSGLFNNMGSFNRRREFRKSENLKKPITKGKIQHRWTVATPGILEKQLCSCYLDARYGQFAERHKAVAWGLWLGGMPFKLKQWPVSPSKNWFCRLCSPSLGLGQWWHHLPSFRFPLFHSVRVGGLSHNAKIAGDLRGHIFCWTLPACSTVQYSCYHA